MVPREILPINLRGSELTVLSIFIGVSSTGTVRMRSVDTVIVRILQVLVGDELPVGAGNAITGNGVAVGSGYVVSEPVTGVTAV